jgi:hypothetical protein
MPKKDSCDWKGLKICSVEGMRDDTYPGVKAEPRELLRRGKRCRSSGNFAAAAFLPFPPETSQNLPSRSPHPQARYTSPSPSIGSAIRAVDPDHLVLRPRKMRSGQRFSYLALDPEETRALNAAYHERIHHD